MFLTSLAFEGLVLGLSTALADFRRRLPLHAEFNSTMQQ
jgi:hypothetical protein